MYLFGEEWWPKVDPITNRSICHACWNLKHKQCGKPLLTGHECDCVHLSEDTFAQQEKARTIQNRRAKTLLLHEMRDDPSSPLRAINDKYKGA